MADLSVQFDFFGAGLRVEANKPGWCEVLARQFPDFVTERIIPSGHLDLRIVETEDAFATHDLPLTWQGEMPDGFQGQVFETEELSVLKIQERVTVEVDHLRCKALASVRTGTDKAVFASAVMFMIDAALTAGGQQLLHGACLLEGSGDSAVLICVPSGGGKTTTSLALARDGFLLMTDDASVLISNSDATMVWGFPRSLKVHRKTAELLPWVGPLADRWDKNGEQGLTLNSLSEKISVTSPKPMRLGAIFLLGSRSMNGHRITRLSKADMLVAIAHDNVSWRPSGMTSKSLHSFEVLARAVADVPSFVISAGEELETLPGMISDTLAAYRRSKQPL